MSLINFQKKIGVTADGAFGPGTFKRGAAYYKLSPNRAAHFFAQTAHESGNFKTFSENLNYSAKGLRSTFGKYFKTNMQAQMYARQPQRIANRVYANRMGNGDEASGEGWLFRGRGSLQLTGKFNYTKCSEGLGVDLVSNPDLLLEPIYAARSAGWFWKSNNLAAFADAGDIKGMTKKINGGFIGLEQRQALYDACLKAF